VQRIIGHLDLDAFFASVEERDHEWLRGKPIVVGADPLDGNGRGVVSTANYAARAYGIHSAMPISTAWQFAEAARTQGKPAVEFVGTDHNRYAEVSEAVMSILRDHVPLIEQASIDEAYFDASFTGAMRTAAAIVQRIKDEISARERLSCSVGIGPNKLIAKIASDIKKPDGLTIVPLRRVREFLDPLPIRILPGVGPKTEVLFLQRGIATVADLQKFSRAELTERMGKWGADLYDKARGIDPNPVSDEYDIKSVGEQQTFPVDSKDPNFIMERLEAMCENIIQRLSHHEFSGFRTVAVTIRFANFETASRSRTFATPASSKNILLFEAMRLLMPFFDKRENPHERPIRLIGVRVEKLINAYRALVSR